VLMTRAPFSKGRRLRSFGLGRPRVDIRSSALALTVEFVPAARCGREWSGVW
jgi:hypothetical protein